MMNGSLSTRRAAELLRVSESTLRRWCDRNLLRATRTAGGHRRVELADLLDFARERKLTIRGASSNTDELESTDIRERLHRHFLEGDSLSVRRLLTSAAAQAIPPAVLCDEVIAPAMHRIGEAWRDLELDIFQEHAATDAVHHSLVALRDLVARTPGPRAVCASLTADPYSIGPAMVALVLRSESFQTTVLGVNTPALEVGKAALRIGAKLVAVSVGAIADPDEFIEQFNTFKRRMSTANIAVAVGGRALVPDVRKAIEADFFGETMVHLASFARRTRRSTNGAA